MSLASELQQHFIPFIHHEINVDILSDSLIACLTSAANTTMPHAHTCVVHSRKQLPWFNVTCKQALVRQEVVKAPGIDGILADMLKDGGDLVQECLLWLFNCMLASHFPERLSVGLITAVHKSGDKFDMSNYRGITVGSVIAKLFAMIIY